MPPRNRFAAALLLCPLTAGASGSAEAACRGETFEGAEYTLCSFDPAKVDLRIFWRDGEGAPYRTFPALASALEAEGAGLAFAMNGGMYDEAFNPIGLYVEEGRELAPVNTESVTGAPAQIPNFYKKPNGVFFIADGKAGVMDTDTYLAERPATEFATQSGPMLVIDGAIHPAFIEDSSDRKPRNGVGICGPSEVQLAVSEDRVNVHAFARFFRDHLGCDDALFLDGGTAPGLYAPELDREDAPGHGGYGPIIGVVGE